jgi:hypothetical protein
MRPDVTTAVKGPMAGLQRDRANAKGLLLSATLSLAFLASTAQAEAQAPPQPRLQAIFEMSAEDMAATSAFTRRAYEAQIASIYRIQSKQIRDIVLDFVRNPRATAFQQPSKQSWLASPGSGWKSHHSYPGGLAVHTMEWVEVASAWVDAYDRVYGVKLDRDLVIAGLILHDWGKVWFLFDDASGVTREPDWYPKAWGTKANWKWMGGHGAVLYAELIARGVPNDLLFSAAAAHFDAYWALDKDGEGLNPALREAAEIVKKQAPVVKPEERMAEWWIITATDEAWSFSTMVAAKFAFEILGELAKDLGLKADSREANKLAWFVLSRVGDFKVYEIYQKAGYRRDAALRFVRSVLDDPSPYEVPGR